MTKTIKKQISVYPQVKWMLVLALGLSSFDSFAQIPERAIAIADSVCKTRLYCNNTRIVLEDSIYYPIFKNEYQDRKTESYSFTYKVYLRDNIESELSISIEHDFSIEFISGLPDSSYQPLTCDILPIEELWRMARKKGLKAKFKRCRYSIWYSDDGISIWLHERRTRWDVDHYSLNAVTGEYYGHSQMNVTF